jgi:aminoglycoside phosphotransferase family enzyme/predicted kinase
MADESFRLIEFLKNPSSYPHRPRQVRHIQTHVSHVFIASPYVYKVKKPVNFGFLDFSTLEKRRYYCEKEVELNRRLCDIYLGVEEISELDGGLTFGRGRRVVEYAVKMRELPEECFLKNLLSKGRVKEEDFIRVVDKLVEFYRSQRSNEYIREFGKPDKIRFNVDENFTQTECFIGDTISKAAFSTLRLYNDLFFEKRSSVFEERVKRGFIKDCHGDLHLEHINLNPEGICIYDCIEFNERFRYIDVASDVAFLSMDLDYNGYRELSKIVVSEISRRMNDETIFDVIEFYKCYRAYVRGKVESFRGEDKEVSEEERKKAKERAKEYFRLALNYAVCGSMPVFFVIFGIIGTGKTTLATALSKELSCAVISSDSIRKEIMGIAPTERVYSGFGEGIYSRDVTERTYSELLERGKRIVESGGAVILDASFSKAHFRKRVISEADLLKVPVYFIETKASDEAIRKRLIEREIEGSAVSDGRVEIFERFKEEFEIPSELSSRVLISVDTEGNLEDALTHTLCEVVSKRFL